MIKLLLKKQLQGSLYLKILKLKLDQQVVTIL
jgi:hypothetical protein